MLSVEAVTLTVPSFNTSNVKLSNDDSTDTVTLQLHVPESYNRWSGSVNKVAGLEVCSQLDFPRQF